THEQDDRERQGAEREPAEKGEHRHPGDARCAQHVEVAAKVHGYIDCRAVPVKTDAIGKSYPPFEYELGKEKIGEYARAVGEESPVHFDRAGAREAGFRDIVAP